MNYKPDTPAEITGFPQLMDFLMRQLRNISSAINSMQPNIMEELHVAPSKLRDGLLAFADGSDWDPGSGQGVYAYYAGAWHKLG